MLEPYQKPDLKKVNLRSGALLPSGTGAILAGLERLDEIKTEHTIAYTFEPPDRWMGTVLKWTSNAVCPAVPPARKFHAMGMDGGFLTFGDGTCDESKLGKGIFRRLDCVAGQPHAVGHRGLLRRLAGSGEWQPIEGASTQQGFEAIAGFSNAEAYAVGTHGTLCRIEGGRVVTLDAPTNRTLTGVSCGSDGDVYCCGLRGTLLRGRGDRWRALENELTTENFWDIHLFQGRVFVASMLCLYEWRNDALEPVAFEEDIPMSAYRLCSAADRVMWSVGTKDLMAFDGRAWTRVL